MRPTENKTTNDKPQPASQHPLAAASQPNAVYSALQTLEKSYAFAYLQAIGTSRLGHSIPCLAIGSGAKEIMINAAHHANEWITTPLLLRFMEEYIRRHNPEITLHCIPLVNPDGVALVTGGIPASSPAYKAAQAMAKNHPVQLSQPFPASWKSNIIGVDLNSNYPANWPQARQNKFAKGYNQPGPRDYVGPQPLSEPETCAMVAYTKTHDFALTLSLHTQGEEIYWHYPGHNPPQEKEIATKLSQASGYQLEKVPDTSSHAGYRDWFIQTYNRPGFTIECGLGESPLPPGDFERIYAKLAPLLWAAVS
ncbi:MAG: M14 family metallocarboxypeptidase [Defluviitaleaceae bacterium]|nr:M14 family metallocarboxypeptidase [Defluviitaleaceae bacterium]